MRNTKKFSFPKGFFTKSRPHATKQDEDYIPFEWSKNVLNGKSKAKIVSLKRKNIGQQKLAYFLITQ